MDGLRFNRTWSSLMRSFWPSKLATRVAGSTDCILVEWVSESLQAQQSLRLMLLEIFTLLECIITTSTFLTSDN